MPALALTLEGVTRLLPLDEQEGAMKQYWDARQSGDPSAKLVKVDRDPDPDDDPEPDPPGPPTPPGTVSEVAKARISEQERWLTESGFVLPPPIFAAGTRVLALGDENFRLERRRVSELPRFAQGAQAVRDQVAREEREDHRFDLRHFSMNYDGTVAAGLLEELPLEVPAFKQLAQLAGFGCGTRYLAELCPAELRAKNVNYQVDQIYEARELVLRTRLDGEGRRRGYAVVTPTYAAVDTDQVLAAVEPALEGARAEIVYDGSGVKATAYWMPDQVVDLAAGDVFKVGVRISTDDTGRGRIRISGVVFRNLCLNLIIIGEGEVETVNQVHRGDRLKILETISQGVEKARESVHRFLDAWGHARTVKVDPREVLREIVSKRKLELPGVRSAEAREKVIEDLLAAWETEPGDTLADVANAVSRAAHTTGKYDHLLQEALEYQAAELVLLPR